MELMHQDPEDRHFDGNLEWDSWKSDPSVGAVLCGFDRFVSTSSTHPYLCRSTGVVTINKAYG